MWVYQSLPGSREKARAGSAAGHAGSGKLTSAAAPGCRSHFQTDQESSWYIMDGLDVDAIPLHRRKRVKSPRRCVVLSPTKNRTRLHSRFLEGNDEPIPDPFSLLDVGPRWLEQEPPIGVSLSMVESPSCEVTHMDLSLSNDTCADVSPDERVIQAMTISYTVTVRSAVFEPVTAALSVLSNDPQPVWYLNQLKQYGDVNDLFHLYAWVRKNTTERLTRGSGPPPRVRWVASAVNKNRRRGDPLRRVCRFECRENTTGAAAQTVSDMRVQFDRLLKIQNDEKGSKMCLTIAKAMQKTVRNGRDLALIMSERGSKIMEAETCVLMFIKGRIMLRSRYNRSN